MEIKEWTYDEIPEFTEEIEGVSRISTTGDELGTICFPGVVYETIDGQEYHLQILKPISRNQNELPVKYPCVVYVQGSAWMQQNVFEKIGMLARLAERGYVIAVVEYRHSGIAKFPAQAQDTRNAIRFIKKNASDFNVDGDNIFLAGDSSGGHTVLFAGILKDDEKEANLYPGFSADVKGIVSYYASASVMLDDGMPSTLNHHMPDSPEGMEMGHVDLRDDLELRKMLSVEYNVEKSTELPPILMFHGTKDRVINTRVSVTVYQRLKELGKEVTLYLIEGGDHGGAEYWTKEVLDIVDDFFRDRMDTKEE